MTVEEALYRWLTSGADVRALVGDKIYPQETDQDVNAPFVLYTTSDARQEETLAGWLNLWACSVRFDSYGGPIEGAYRSAKAITAAIDARMKALSPGQVVGESADAGRVEIKGISGDGGEDGLEAPVHGDESGVDYVGAAYRVSWSYPALDS